jgi:hypothetical protein
MNRWIVRASVLFFATNLALACGDDEDDGNAPGSGGSAGKGGSGGKGGTSSSGGSAGEGEGGTPEPGSGGGGGAPEPVTCQAPTPPDVGEGGAGGGGAASGEALEIVGTYVDNFDSDHEITSATWTNFGVYNISQFDNEARYVIAQNDESNGSFPCLWSRFDWTLDGEDLYYCQSAYNAESEEAALEAEPADPEDLDKGCGGFEWSQLTAE